MKEISLKDLKKIKNRNIFTEIFFFIVFFAISILCLIGTIILFLNYDSAYIKMPEALIAMIVIIMFFLGISIYFLKQIKEENKISNNIEDLIIEEDYVYDRYCDNSSDTMCYYVFLKINGEVGCNTNLYNSINKNDIIYVVKEISSNKIINTYRKNDVILSNELNKIVKKYDYNYINEKFNHQIENRKQYVNFIECKNCKKNFKYNKEKGVCPYCRNINKLELEDLVYENEWY